MRLGSLSQPLLCRPRFRIHHFRRRSVSIVIGDEFKENAYGRTRSNRGKNNAYDRTNFDRDKNKAYGRTGSDRGENTAYDRMRSDRGEYFVASPASQVEPWDPHKAAEMESEKKEGEVTSGPSAKSGHPGSVICVH